jgi:hypothetical protein
MGKPDNGMEEDELALTETSSKKDGRGEGGSITLLK